MIIDGIHIVFIKIYNGVSVFGSHVLIRTVSFGPCVPCVIIWTTYSINIYTYMYIYIYTTIVVIYRLTIYCIDETIR